MTNREFAAVIGGNSAVPTGLWWFLGTSSTVWLPPPRLGSLFRRADLYGELSFRGAPIRPHGLSGATVGGSDMTAL